jgi:hypothetical protein
MKGSPPRWPARGEPLVLLFRSPDFFALEQRLDLLRKQFEIQRFANKAIKTCGAGLGNIPRVCICGYGYDSYMLEPGSLPDAA